MEGIVSLVRRFVKEEEGIAVTEYGLLLALLVVVFIVAVNLFGKEFFSWWKSNVQGITTNAVATPVS